MPIQAQDIQKLQQAIEASNIVELRSVLSKLGPGEWLPSCLRKAGVTAHEWKEFHPLEYALWCGKKRITHNAKLYNPALRKDNVEQILILKELMKYSRLSDSQFREQRPTAGYTNSYELLFDLVMRSGIDDLYVQAHHDSGAHAEFFKDECLTWQFLTICLPKKFKASDLDYSRGFAANFKYVSGLGSGLIRLASQASISLEQFNKILNDHFDSSLVDRCARTWLELQPIPMTELGVQKSLALLKKMFGNMKKTSGSEFIFDRIPPSITQLLHKVIKATEAESRQDVMNELRAAFDGVRLLPSEIDSLNNIFLLMRAELSLQISNIVSPSARQPQQQFAPVPVVQMHMAPIMQPVPQPQPAVLPAGGNALPQNQEAILNDELGSLIKFVFPIVLFGSMGKKLKGVYESETPPDRVKEIIRHFCKQRISDERKLNSYLDRFMRDFGNPAIAHWVEQYGGAIPPLFLNRALTQPQVELVRTIKQDLFLKYLKKHTELLLQACYLECEDSSHPEWEMKVMTHYLVGKSTTLPSSYKFCDKKDDQFVRRRKQEFSDKNPHALPIVKMLDLSSHRFISTPLMREDYRNKLGLPALGGGISHVDFFYHMFQYTHLMLSQRNMYEITLTT
ncbi:MAG: hypothetical protein A3F10_02445 [Coxiella sp. RIFCSPHIGHO2_12_FULL_42_15]|nr:MAG: hypothetical protein A3F10_02445 [Coxiella sp. RIFCSPHIGHO2_12_FULL_42_15]